MQWISEVSKPMQTLEHKTNNILKKTFSKI